jgi:ABC-type oligopeptide transport system ATPase subunit
MYLGRIIEVAAKADLYERPLHPYTRAARGPSQSVKPPGRNYGRKA